MESNTPPAQVGRGSPEGRPLTGSSKAGMIGLAIAMLVIGLVAGYYMGNGKSGDVAYQTATPTTFISPSPSATLDTTGWHPYMSSAFSLSFKVPPGFGVLEEESIISIAKGEPYHDMEKGNNIFMSLFRYTAGETQASKLNKIRGGNGGVESTMSVDGRSFPLVDYSATPEPRFYVLFEKFYVQVEPQSSGLDPSIDYLDIGRQILSTFRFTASTTPTTTTGWKKYETKAGFSIQYPQDWSIQSAGFSSGVGQVTLKGTEGLLTIARGSFGGGVCADFGGSIETIQLGQYATKVCNKNGVRSGSCGNCGSATLQDYSVGYSPTSENHKSLFDSIFSTFRLVQ